MECFEHQKKAVQSLFKKIMLLLVFAIMTQAYRDIKKGFVEGFMSVKNTVNTQVNSPIIRHGEGLAFNHYFILSDLNY